MSESWPVKVCTALPVRMSHTLAVASHDPETNRLALGASEILGQSASHLGAQGVSQLCREKLKRDSPHDIPSMIIKFHRAHTLLNVPEHTSHITRARYDLTIINESTTRQVSRVRRQFSSHFDLSGSTWTSVPEGIDGTDVVKTTTSDVLSGRCVGASHYPR